MRALSAVRRNVIDVPWSLNYDEDGKDSSDVVEVEMGKRGALIGCCLAAADLSEFGMPQPHFAVYTSILCTAFRCSPAQSESKTMVVSQVVSDCRNHHDNNNSLVNTHQNQLAAGEDNNARGNAGCSS